MKKHVLALSLSLLAACMVAPGESEDIDEASSDLAATAPAGTCSCNPPPDSTGRWALDKESCSLCSNSSDCARAKCWYKHNVTGETENTGCHFSSGSAADIAETLE